jgi:hydroxymethylpyrimidine pyrophosphatase-like HAD family hydrolase
MTMLIYVDIDETICFYENERIYNKAIPNFENISKINKLYDEGHEIVYWTARASVYTEKRKEYLNLTKKQLKNWGCKHHKLIVGEKPNYDLLICDKAKRVEEI